MFGRKAKMPARNRSLCIEPLESRVVLDGNVRAFVSGGVLRLEGDFRHNEIIIEQSSLRSFRISSRDGTTLINGQPNPRTFFGVGNDLNVSLGSGNDVVKILGTSEDAVTVSDRLVINTGSGADQVLLSEVHAIGLNVNTGSGDDIVNVGDGGAQGGLEITKEALILTDGGQDDVSISNSLFKRFVVVNMGNNNDQTTLEDTRVRQRSTFIGGSGFDRLNRQRNSGELRFISFERTRNTVQAPTPIPPLAANDTASVVRGSSVAINVAANDTSANSSLNLASIAIVPTDPPDNGTVVVNANGTVTYTANSGGTATTDAFQYTIRNQQGTVSNTATVTITLAAAFATVEDPATVTEDASPNTATGNVLTNDTGGVGTRTVTAVGGVAGNVGVNVNSQFGTFRINADGSFTYTLDNSNATVNALNTGSTPLTDTISYTANAGGGASSTANLVITIQGTNELAAADDGGAVTEDAPPNTATGNVLTNDTGGAGTKTVTAVNGSTTSVGASVRRLHGSFVIEADGDFTYTLDNTDPDLATLDADETITDTITYTVTAGTGTATATLTITITGANEPIAAVADAEEVTEDATANTATGNVLTNDTGGGATKTVTAVNGSTTSVGVSVQRLHGSFVIEPDGDFTYTLDNSDADLATLDADETMTDTITYTVTSDGQTSTATLTITITGVNEIAAAPDSGTVTEDAATNTALGNVLTNDTGGGPTKTVTAVNGAAGSVDASVPRSHGSFVIDADGDFNYTLDNSDTDLATLDAGEALTDTIEYTVTSGGSTDTATLTITITGVDEIAAVPDSGSVIEDATTNTATGNVLTNDTGGGPTKTVTAVNGSATSVGASVQRSHGAFLIESDGDFTYTLDNDDADLATLDAGETLTDTIDYTVTSGGQTSTATLTITIQGATDGV